MFVFFLFFSSLQSCASDAERRQLDADNKALYEQYFQERLQAEQKTWKEALLSSGYREKEAEERCEQLLQIEQAQKQKIKQKSIRQPCMDQSVPSYIIKQIQEASKKHGISVVDIETFTPSEIKEMPNPMFCIYKALEGENPTIKVNPKFFYTFYKDPEGLHKDIVHELTHLIFAHPHVDYRLREMCPNLTSMENNRVILQQEITAETLLAAKNPAEGYRIYDELNRQYKNNSPCLSVPTHPTPGYSANEIKTKIFSQYTPIQRKALAAARSKQEPSTLKRGLVGLKFWTKRALCYASQYQKTTIATTGSLVIILFYLLRNR